MLTSTGTCARVDGATDQLYPGQILLALDNSTRTATFLGALRSCRHLPTLLNVYGTPAVNRHETCYLTTVVLVNSGSSSPTNFSSVAEPRLVVMMAASIPPVQGQALIAHRMGIVLTQSGSEVRFVSRNPKQLWRGPRYYIELLGGIARALFLSSALRRRGPKTVYLTCSGGQGIWVEGLCVALLLRRNDRLVVHHHSFAYLNEPTAAFRTVLKVIYRRGYHVAGCDHMATLLARAGVDPERISVVSNAAFVDKPIDSPATEGRPSGLVLGHLSNLSVEKGLDLALGVLADTPENVSLIVYGAPVDTRAHDLLQDTMRKFPGRLHHIQPTDRKAVWAFFCSIDLFLFPSRYRNEAAPLVVLEALAAGVPVLATDRGCIPSQLEPELADLVVTLDEFPVRAKGVALAMLDNENRIEVQRRARRQWNYVESLAGSHLAKLLELIVPAAERLSE